MRIPPRIKQRDLSDCGAACLACVSGFYGSFLPVSKIRQWAGTDSSGTSIWGIVQAAQKMEMEAKAMRWDVASFRELPLPAIVHVIINKSVSHFMVVASITNNEIMVMDPAEGKYRKISFEEFRKLWTGVMVIAVPGGNFRKLNKVPEWFRISRLVRNHRPALAAAMVFAIAFSLLGLATSLYVKEIVDVVLEGKNIPILITISILMVGILILQYFAGLAKSFLVLRTSQTIDKKLILGYYNHLLHLPQNFFDSMRVGEMVSRINDAVRINIFINEVAVSMIVNFLIVIFSLLVMFLFNWKLSLIMLIIIPLFGFLYYMNDRVSKLWQRKIMESGAELETQLVQSLNAAGTIKKLRLEKFMIDKISHKFFNLLNNTRIFSVKQIYVHSTADLLTRLLAVIVLWAGCYYVFMGELTNGELLSFYALVGYFTGPVLYLLSSGKHIRDATIAAERLFEIMELETEKQCADEKESFIRKGSIFFKNISFRYGNGTAVLKDFNLKIAEGTITGIKGASGSGKSTIAALLLKVYEPANGQINIGDADITTIGIDLLRKGIAIVPQHTDLFNGSILENIILDQPYDLEKLMEISAKLGMTDFINDLPYKWDTIINEQGANLSGGQKQRISVARALYRNAGILILDEPTASLDEESENRIMQTIDWYNSKGNTVIIIAHHDTSLKICDNIVVLNNGRIV
jgi:ABC-type bacteriocin transporter